MKRHILFGGTFDPPHMGHHQILKSLLADPPAEKIHLVPTSMNPLKNDKPLGTPEERLEWISLWLKRVEKEVPPEAFSKLDLYTDEISSSGPSYTIHTLKKLKDLYPSTEWVLAVGGDIAPDLHRWKNIEELFSHLQAVWIIPRKTKPHPLKTLLLDEKLLKKVLIWDLDIEGISSTEIRNYLKTDPQKLKDILFPEIFKSLLQKK